MNATDDRVEAALRTLDPAADLPPTHRVDDERSLAAILATDPHDPNTVALTPRRRSSIRRRALGVSAGVAAATAAFVILPGTLDANQAYASWSEKPTSVSPSELTLAAEHCRDRLSLPQRGVETLEEAQARWAATPAVLADRRGEWTYVLLAKRRGFEGYCMTQGGSDFEPFMTGRSIVVDASSGEPFSGEEPAPAADEIAIMFLEDGSAEEGEYVATAGRLGENVASVIMLTEDGRRVLASVADGYFAAWWPMTDRPATDFAGPKAEYIVTLRDGTVLPAQSLGQFRADPAGEVHADSTSNGG